MVEYIGRFGGINMLEEKEIRKIVKEIKRDLRNVPDLKPEDADEFVRISDYNDVLPDVFWNMYDEPNFTNKEMRKLDLSRLCFDNEVMDGINLSYTNVHIDPQKVQDKSLANVNLEGTHLYGKSFDGTVLYGTNLKFTEALIDFNKIAVFDRRTRLEECFVLYSGVYDKKVPFKVYKGAYIVDDLTRTFEENLDEYGKIVKAKTLGPIC